MIVNQKQLFSFVDELLKSQGFVKKKDTWYKYSEETICIFSLGKEPFSGRYGNLLGVFVKAISKGLVEFPPYYKKHLGVNLENLGVPKEQLWNVFNLENNSYKENEREFYIKDIIENTLLPFLKKFETIQGIRTAISAYEFLDWATTVVLRDFLNTTTVDKFE